MKAIGSVFSFLFLICFSIYILLPYNKCTRVERMTVPIQWMTSLSDVIVRPWVEADTRYEIASSWVAARIQTSAYLEKQLFHESKEERVDICGWKDVVIPPFEETEAGAEFMQNKIVEEAETSDVKSRKCYLLFTCNEPADIDDYAPEF